MEENVVNSTYGGTRLEFNTKKRKFFLQNQTGPKKVNSKSDGL